MIAAWEPAAGSGARPALVGGEHPVLLGVDGVTLQYPSGADLVTATWRVSFNVHHMDRYILLGAVGVAGSPRC